MFALPRRSFLASIGFAAVLMPLVVASAFAANWTRFRGENGSGVSTDGPIPAEWGDDKNLAWSIDLPGDGKSCPIVVGDRVFLTAWTGTGPDDLMRHVLCYDRKTGQEIWRKDVKPVVQDEAYRGMFTQNGYASHTPVSDGERLYVFFGVSGVTAYDLDGNELWGPVSVGTDFNDRDWGSASSPILTDKHVIITAGAESKAMVALDKADGHEAWNQPADALGGIWGTPVLMDAADGQRDIVIGVGGEVWGVNSENGKLRWYAASGEGDGARISAITDGGLAIMLAERGGNAIAVPGGGKGDVTDQIAWGKNYRGNIGTPVAQDGLIYWVANNQLNCVDAKTGEEVYTERLQAPPAPAGAPAPPAEPAAQAGEPGRPGPGGRRGGRGGGMGGQDYSSPIIADGKVIFARRDGHIYVFKTGREFEQLAVNKFSGEADYSASPAASDGQLFIRSNKKLYCVAAK